MAAFPSAQVPSTCTFSALSLPHGDFMLSQLRSDIRITASLQRHCSVDLGIVLIIEYGLSGDVVRRGSAAADNLSQSRTSELTSKWPACRLPFEFLITKLEPKGAGKSAYCSAWGRPLTYPPRGSSKTHHLSSQRLLSASVTDTSPSLQCHAWNSPSPPAEVAVK